MTRRLLKIFGISACMAAAFSMSAFAEEITSVSFAAGCDTEASLSEGNTDPVFVVNDANAEYELSSYSATSDSDTYKSAKTYELTFEANSGYTFPSSANSITVTGKGITEITKKTVDSDTTLVVKVKAYPYHMWEAPTIESGDLDGKKISWKKGGAPTSEYIIKWTNTAGEQKVIHSTSSNSSVSISSYNKEYKGSNEDYSDAHVDGFAVRVKGTAGNNPYTAPSDWVVLGDVDPAGDAEIETYDSWGDLYEGVSSVGGSSSSKNSSGSNGPGGALNGWIEANNYWYYYNNGSKAAGWIQDGGNWYYINPQTGVMQTGWAIVDSKRYYLNPNEGGPKGAMVTGSGVSIDGKTYTFASSGEVVSES